MIYLKKAWKLSDEEARRFRAKEVEVLDPYRKSQLYGEFVTMQRPGFEKMMNLVNNWVNELSKNGQISELFEIRARIKAIESAVYNDARKALDDVFGMEIITATEEEVEIIVSKILENTEVVREKNHNKKNGYKAQHKLLGLTKEKCKEMQLSDEEISNMPLVEMQFKTMEVAVKSSGGTADHSLYKGETKEGVQSKYDANGFKKPFNVPTMWVSKDGKMVELSTNETLKKMYPFLKVKDNQKEVK